MFCLLFQQGLGLGNDWEMSEEDQMLRAIAMSLGEKIANEDEAETEEVEIKLGNEEPVPKESMDKFTCNILHGCLRLLDTLPETVYRICDLLLAVAQRNGEEWCVNMITELLQEIYKNISALIESAEPMRQYDKRSVSEWASQLSQMSEATKAATRIHLYTLLFEEMRIQCAGLFSKLGIIDNMVHLLEIAQNLLTLVASNNKNDVSTPKWLAPLILLIDLYDKAAVASARRAPLLQTTKRQWKWFDDRSGKWTSYLSPNNKLIDDAYKNGEQLIRFSAGRRKYTVQLSTMVQINEETGNWRPIMFVIDDKQQLTSENGKAMEVTEETTSKSTSDKVVGLEHRHCVSLIRALVGLINIPVEADTLHAVMRLCLRLTRNYEISALFAELGGVRAILQLTQASAFAGFTSLASLIIRHVLEEPITLKQAMEKVIRLTTHHSPMGCKEMNYIMRVLGPAACRNGQLFTEVAKLVLRINLQANNRRDDDDLRNPPNQPQLLKVLPGKLQTETLPQSAVALTKDVICDLLNALTVKISNTTEEANPTASTSSTANNATTSTGINREMSSSDLLQQDDVDESSIDEASNDNSKAATSTAEEDSSNKKNRLLLTQSSILRLLAELTRSYNIVAKLICDHVYQSGKFYYFNY